MATASGSDGCSTLVVTLCILDHWKGEGEGRGGKGREGEGRGGRIRGGS